MQTMMIKSAPPTTHVPRPDAGFAPSPWGDRFLDYTPDTKVNEARQEMAKELKEGVRRELLSVGEMPVMEQLRWIDSIERLGVGYHFEKEIEDALWRIYDTSMDASSDDLVLTSLRFRLLRQHGFKVSTGAFKRFIGPNGSLKEEVSNDIQGMLSLYEACHVKIHGEHILDEALAFTKSNLNKSLSDQLLNNNPRLEERIRHALAMGLHKRLSHYECVRYMQVYQEDDPNSHNKSLLRFAKVDFNLVQASHKKELDEISRWWKQVDFTSKLPLRDRMVESYFWATCVYYDPQHSLARKVSAMGSQIITSIDDIYDAYATIEECQIFTQAIQRWDKSCLDQLPTEELRWFYQTLILDAHEEMERLLAPLGRSQYVDYAKQEIKALCRTYMTEATWRHNKYIPTIDEYMANDLCRNMAYVAATVYTFLGLDSATHTEFEWLCSLPKPVKAVCYLLRILDDIGGNEFDENRGVSSLYIQCYMKEYGLSYEEACEKLYKKADELWKDLNEGMSVPGEVPVPVYKCVLNMSRAVEVIYDGAEDGFTLINNSMKQIIKTLFIDSVPM